MHDLQPGQVFTYRSRESERDSRVIICSLEDHPEFGRIAHVSVEGVAMTTRRDAGTVTDVIHHMPFDEASLRESLVELEATRRELPDFQEGYATWKTAANRGEAGVFAISVAEAVDFIEQSMR